MNRRDFVTRLALALALPPSLYIGSASAQTLQRELGEATGLELTDRQVSMLSQVCEAIIPATDTPGARAADVHGFVALLFSEWMNSEEQLAFQKGLNELESSLVKSASKPVHSITDPEMSKLIEQEAGVLESPEESDYKAFFKELRAFAIVGYYTSEIGQKQELNVQFGAGQNTDVGPSMAKSYTL